MISNMLKLIYWTDLLFLSVYTFSFTYENNCYKIKYNYKLIKKLLHESNWNWNYTTSTTASSVRVIIIN